MLTAEDTVRRIGVSRRPRPSVDEPGAIGIHPEPAAAIARRRGGQSRRAAGARTDVAVGEGGVCGVEFFRKRRRLAAVSECAKRGQLSPCRANGSNRPF
jgi:hypothetical protein